MENNPANNGPIMCANNCGFFGNPMFENMCSQCFKDSKKSSSPQPQPQSPSPVVSTPAAVQKEEVFPETKVQVVEEGKEEEKKPLQENKSKCFVCKSKITIAKQISNKCRCDYVFCDSHRVPANHDCTFDHQTFQKQVLSKKNPGVDENKGGRSFTRIE